MDFYLPLAFYAFDWLVFFLAIPRSWSFVQRQRSGVQTLESAKPAALDIRFKLASMFALVCLGLIVFRLTYSGRIYRLKIPYALLLVVGLLAVRTAYAIVGSFVWTLSPYRLGVSIGWLYGLGYAPVVLVLFVLNLAGYLEENEDKALIAQRARRGDELQTVSSLTKRGGRDQMPEGKQPARWSKPRDHPLSPLHALKMPRSRLRHDFDYSITKISPSHSYPTDESGQHWWNRRKESEKEARLRKIGHDATHAPSARPAVDSDNDRVSQSSRWTERDTSTRLHSGDGHVTELGASESVHSMYSRSRSEASRPSSSTHSLQSRPQVVRSMLDV